MKCSHCSHRGKKFDYCPKCGKKNGQLSCSSCSSTIFNNDICNVCGMELPENKIRNGNKGNHLGNSFIAYNETEQAIRYNRIFSFLYIVIYAAFIAMLLTQKITQDFMFFELLDYIEYLLGDMEFFMNIDFVFMTIVGLVLASIFMVIIGTIFAVLNFKNGKSEFAAKIYVTFLSMIIVPIILLRSMNFYFEQGIINEVYVEFIDIYLYNPIFEFIIYVALGIFVLRMAANFALFRNNEESNPLFLRIKLFTGISYVLLIVLIYLFSINTLTINENGYIHITGLASLLINFLDPNNLGTYYFEGGNLTIFFTLAIAFAFTSLMLLGVNAVYTTPTKFTLRMLEESTKGLFIFNAIVSVIFLVLPLVFIGITYVILSDIVDFMNNYAYMNSYDILINIGMDLNVITILGSLLLISIFLAVINENGFLYSIFVDIGKK